MGLIHIEMFATLDLCGAGARRSGRRPDLSYPGPVPRDSVRIWPARCVRFVIGTSM